MERFWYLKHAELFEGLEPEELRRLESRAIVREFGRKEIIYFPSDPGATVLLLFQGRVKIKSVTPDGKEAILTFIEPGELFGELSLFEDAVGHRGEFAEAVTASTACAVPREALIELMEQHAGMALRVTKLIGRKRLRIENRMKTLLFRSFRDRLLALLVELAERYGQPAADGQIAIGLKLSHQELASLIGATRETVTILLGELQMDRTLHVEKRQIVLLGIDKIRQELDGHPQPGFNGKGNVLGR